MLSIPSTGLTRWNEPGAPKIIPESLWEELSFWSPTLTERGAYSTRAEAKLASFPSKVNQEAHCIIFKLNELSEIKDKYLSFSL